MSQDSRKSQNMSESRSSMTQPSTFYFFSVDQEKRPMIVIFLHLIPVGSQNQEVIDLVMEKVRLICSEPFAILVVLQPSDMSLSPHLVYTVHTASSREIRKNIKQFIIIYPSSFLSIIINSASKVTSPKFKKKIRVCSNLTELRDILPHFVVSDDRLLAYNMTVDPTFQAYGQLYKKEVIDLVKYDGGKDYQSPIELLKLLPDQLSNLFEFLMQHAPQVKGVFRKSPHTKHVKTVQGLLDQGIYN